MSIIQLPSTNKITVDYGRQPGYPKNEGDHRGVDFAFGPDPYAYLPEDGQVGLILNNGDDGNAAYAWAENRKHALCHLERFLVQPGYHKRGTKIGVIGDTGYAKGKHLHWAVQVDGFFVHPMTLVTGGRGAAEQLMDEKEIKAAFRTIMKRDVKNDDEWRPWLGKRFIEFADWAARQDEYKFVDDVVLRRYPNDQKVIADLRIQRIASVPTITVNGVEYAPKGN